MSTVDQNPVLAFADPRGEARSHASRQTPGYRPDIDALRALAVASVVVFHAFPNWLPGGFVGVDVFFVISGYLITSHILRELDESRFSFRSFYGKRIRRIFPALLITLIGTYAAGWFNLLPEEFKVLGKHIAGGALSVANLVLWREAGYFDATADQKPLLHLWSLGVEEQFYLFWPVILWGMSRAKRSSVWAIAILGTLSFVSSIVAVRMNPVFAFYLPVTRAWELMVGSLLAYQESRRVDCAIGFSEGGVVAGALLLLTSIGLLNSHLTFPGWWAIGPTLGTYLVIRGGRDSALMRRVCIKPVLLLGLISYPLYLFHWPILSFLRMMSTGVPSWPLRAAAVAIAVPLAWLTYRFVELPIRRSRRPNLLALSLLILVLGAGFGGYNAFVRNGLEFRMSRLASQFADGVHFDRDREWRRGSCYLEGADEETFAPECVGHDTAPMVFLWGDSHAAAMYPAFRDEQAHYGVRVAEFTASGCPPLLGGNDHCGRISEHVLIALKRAVPHTLILTANWRPDTFAALKTTVAAARDAGVKRIVLLGQVATWQSSLPKLYWLYWRQHHEVLPARSWFAVDPKASEYDRLGKATAEGLGIEYVSAYNAMCDADGCITRTGNGRGMIVTFDGSHLTPSGANAVMSTTASMLLK
ncbi:acyltransferase [Burkholderia ubonensis]|uniref:acyltransferase family protein n=1 Tax=Burkholderia ubonensis TaxID=101571 RepID=UPI0007523CDA|nr:acyltransferase family protein [Burkholderia ubonensis]KVC94769.1 acyltransferase [Burkholderia ubonensis]KWK87792.1 acyltransferase [Burkholderia ubonensis]KWN00438.1 acyltransferase [Burkholderia ubonensis]KWN42665.1 acyltransferase [Burkholderia ubonensis]